MENKKDKVMKFKTNINCGNCIAKVTPKLDESAGIGRWEVDTASPDRILSVHSGEITENDIIKAVGLAGFKAESLPLE
jgi:copper chaperone